MLDDILDAQCPYHKDMRHTLWNCRDFKHSVGNLCHLPHHEEDLENLDNPNNRRGEEVELSHASTEKSTSSSADMGRKKARGNKSSTTVRYWWRPLVLPPRIDGPSTRSPSLGRISGSTSTTRASTCSSSIR
jgi:chromatin remodeling complex protein RSC6